jgi:hypothetical protein
MVHKAECTIVVYRSSIQTFPLQCEKNAGESNVKRASDFRHWVQEIWYKHVDECQQYRETPKTSSEYWEHYKWWLKREFRFQTKDSK